MTTAINSRGDLPRFPSIGDVVVNGKGWLTRKGGTRDCDGPGVNAKGFTDVLDCAPCARRHADNLKLTPIDRFPAGGVFIPGWALVAMRSDDHLPAGPCSDYHDCQAVDAANTRKLLFRKAGLS